MCDTYKTVCYVWMQYLHAFIIYTCVCACVYTHRERDIDACMSCYAAAHAYIHHAKNLKFTFIVNYCSM